MLEAKVPVKLLGVALASGLLLLIGSIDHLLLVAMLIGGVCLASLWRENDDAAWLPVIYLALCLGVSQYFGKATWILPALLGMVAIVMLLPSKVHRGTRWLLASVSMAALLLRASGSGFGPDPMDNWLTSLGLSEQWAWNLTVAFRKCVHFTYFGLLAWTAFRGAISYGAIYSVHWAVVWALQAAILDETRQSSMPNRTGSIWDVLLDMVGAACFVWLASRIIRAKSPAAHDVDEP